MQSLKSEKIIHNKEMERKKANRSLVLDINEFIKYKKKMAERSLTPIKQFFLLFVLYPLNLHLLCGEIELIDVSDDGG